MNVVLTLALILAWIVLGMMTLAIVALARQVGALNRRLPPSGARASTDDPRIGSVAPQFEAELLDGRTVSSESLQEAARSTLIVFLSPDCDVCARLAPALRALARSGDIDVLLSSTAGQEPTERFLSEHRLSDLRTVAGSELPHVFNVGITPYAFLVDQTNTVRSKGLVNGREHLDSLLEAQPLPAVPDERKEYNNVG